MTVLIVNHKYITLSVKLQSFHKGRDVTIKHINVTSIYRILPVLQMWMCAENSPNIYNNYSEHHLSNF